MTLNGYVKIYRSLKDWEWYKDKNVKIVFIDILLSVNFKDSKWKGNDIKRGQFVVGLEKYAKEFDMSVQQLRTVLKKLEKTGEITTKSTNKNTTITLVKFDVYQEEQHEINKQNNNPITNEQQTDNNPITNEQQQRNKDKNIEEEKEELKKEREEKTLPIPISENLEVLEIKKQLAEAQEQILFLKAEKEKEKNCEKKEKGTHKFPVPSSRKAVVKVPPHVIDKQNETQSENMKPYEFLTASYKYPSNWSDLLIEKFLSFCEGRYTATDRKFGANNAKEVISSINTLLLTNSCEIVEFSVSKSIQAGWSSIYLKDNKKNEPTNNNQPSTKGKYQDFADNYKP